MKSETTQFQVEAEQKISQVLAAAGLTIQERRVLTGQMPHMPAPETAVKLRAGGVEISLYADEATYSIAKLDRRFEREDYADGNSLLASLLITLKTDLESSQK